MFPLKIVLVLLLFTCQRPPSELHLPTTAQIIYGKDYRQEPHHVPSLWRDKSRSVAAQIHNYYLTPKGDFYQLSSKNYWKTQSYCQDEKFYGQPLLARCSGFLIASDLIITAGHCHSGCPYYVWVFDYNINSDISSIPRQNVYNCKSSILFHPSGQFNEGFSLIHLNRPVPPHRKPLPLRTSGRIKDSDRVILMGHPMGLPLKIDSGMNHHGNALRENIHPLYFLANLDSYVGNSGSPVLNAQSGLVEGIAVGGGEDFVYDPEKNCYRSRYCPPDTCQGETIMRITTLPHEALQSPHHPSP